jgi:WD40 repeat protein
VLGDEISARASCGIAAFSPDGKWIVTPQQDIQAGFRIFHAGTGRQSAYPMFRMKDSPLDNDPILHHSAQVTCFTWSPEGQVSRVGFRGSHLPGVGDG